jgi:hypothetical protein
MAAVKAMPPQMPKFWVTTPDVLARIVYPRKAPSVKRSPWAKLMSFMTPYTIEYPRATSA